MQKDGRKIKEVGDGEASLGHCTSFGPERLANSGHCIQVKSLQGLVCRSTARELLDSHCFNFRE
jgi:hypothetical protein